MSDEAADEVDRIVEAWSRERPDLDFSPLHVLSRVDRIAKQLEKARADAFLESGLAPWEFDVLAALRRAGPPYRLSPKSLLQQTLVTSGTMTNRIDRLHARGLVERKDDPNDGRGVLVELSDSGRVKVDAVIAALIESESTLLAGLTPAERARITDLLRKLSLGLDEA